MEWTPARGGLRLDSGRIHVWRAYLDRAAEPLDRLTALLSEDEQARAARLRVPNVRARFTACRALLRLLLGMYLDAPAGSLRFGYRQHGKPFLEPAAGVPDIRFNLSHSHGLALFAFVLGREIGVDLEQIRADRDHDKLAARFFSPREAAALAALAPEERRLAFFHCWTRKEAYLKARGEGLAIPLASFTVALGPASPPSLLETDGDPLEPGRWAMAAVEPDPGFAAALAVQGPMAPLDWFELPDGAPGLFPD